MCRSPCSPFVFTTLFLLVAACGGGTGREPLVEPDLALDAVAPPFGAVSGGSLHQVEGRGFDALDPGFPVFVRFGDDVAIGQVLSDAVVVVELPPANAAGAVDVEIVGGARRAMGVRTFTYAPDPVALVVAPAVVAPAAPGHLPTRVTITGGPFSESVAVFWNGAPMAPEAITLADAERLVVDPPATDAEVGVVALRVVDAALDQTLMVRVVARVGPGDVFVNEFLPNPDGVDPNSDGGVGTPGDELVEIVNLRAGPIDLTGVTIEDAASVRHVFPNPTTLPAGGAIVVFGAGTLMGFADPHASGHAQAATLGALGLNNGSDVIRVRAADGTEVFVVSYGSSAAGLSFRAAVDGVSPGSPASDPDYLLEPPSPGRRFDGTPFP